MRRFTSLAACMLACLAMLSARAATACDPAWCTEVDQTVLMSDGVLLDASLYVPAHPRAARIPLIVRQHGGGSNKDNTFDVNHGLAAVKTGDFALLMYSVRGHGNSGGLFDFFGTRTTADFSEMLDWVAAYEHLHGDLVDTGNVGVSGYSQGGGESLLPAEFDSRVKAVAVGNTFDDLNRALNPHDCFKASFATGIFAAAYTASATRVDETLPVRWGTQLYSDTEDVSANPAAPSTTQDLHARSPLTYLSHLIDRRVPVFWTQGWEDQLFPGDMPQHILAPLAATGVPVHYWFNSGGHGATDFGPEVDAREDAMLGWFDQFLRGTDRGFTTGPKVDYWERTSGQPRGAGTWDHHTADAWPVAPATQRWALSPDGTLTTDRHQVSGYSTTPIVNDIASANLANDAVAGIVAQDAGQPDAFRSAPESNNPADTLTFTSAPLATSVTMVGSPHVHVDLDLLQDDDGAVQVNAKLWDVNASGQTLISRACQTLHYPMPQMPGDFSAVDLWPNAHTFPAGDRIMLTVSTVDMPTFESRRGPFAYDIQTSSNPSSFVTLPVVP